MHSVEETIKLKPECVRIYPTLVIKDTELSAFFLSGQYVPLTLEEAVFQVAMAMKRFNAARIKVIRIGLQSSDLIDFDSEVEAGPFHPAFGEWVMSFLFFDAIKRHLDVALQGKTLEIECHPKKISMLLGDKRQNIEKIKNFCYTKGYENVITRQNPDLNEMTVRVVINSIASEIDIMNE